MQDTDSESKIVLITGANSGIGKAAATRFATEGWTVILACRNLEKGEAAKREIQSATASQNIGVMEVDVASFTSIHKFCTEVKLRYSHIDVLINNAGYFNHGIKTYQFSPDGLELTFATNVFGPLLLTELLLGHLEKSRDPRVLNASSTNIKNFFDPKRAIEFDNLRGEISDKRPYTVYKMYGDSKMGLILLTIRMGQEYRKRGVKVNAVMIPVTRISRETMKNFSGIFRIIAPLIQNLNPFALSQKRMGECYFRICTSMEFREVNGKLIDSDYRVMLPAPKGKMNPFQIIRELLRTRHAPAYTDDSENIEMMWNLSQEVIKNPLHRR